MPFLNLLIVILISFKISILPVIKYLIFIIPAFFLGFSVIINKIKEYSRLYGFILLIFSLSLMIITTNPNSSQGFEIVKAINIIQKSKSDSTSVFIFPEYIDLVYTYHYNIEAFKDFGNHRKYLNQDQVYILQDLDKSSIELMSNEKDVLLLIGWKSLLDYDPENNTISHLSKIFDHYKIIGLYRGYTVYHFAN
jgi:hypothetical protein